MRSNARLKPLEVTWTLQSPTGTCMNCTVDVPFAGPLRVRPESGQFRVTLALLSRAKPFNSLTLTKTFTGDCETFCSAGLPPIRLGTCGIISCASAREIENNPAVINRIDLPRMETENRVIRPWNPPVRMRAVADRATPQPGAAYRFRSRNSSCKVTERGARKVQHVTIPEIQ